MHYVQAELSENSVYFGDYLPTYHISSLTWQNAFPVMPMFGWLADIFMVPGNNLNSGPGVITGTVTSLNTRGQMEGVHVMLMNENQEPFTYITTDAQGTFSFDNISYGTYIVHAEIMGVHTTQAVITLDGDTPVAGVNFIVEGNQAFLSIEEPGFISISEVGEVYPNPVSDQASVNIRMKEQSHVTMSVYNLLGNLISVESKVLSKGNNKWEIRTGDLGKGLYLLNIVTDDGDQVSRRLIKTN